MMKILILGAGRMGRAIAFDCLQQDDVNKVTVADMTSEIIEKSFVGIKDDKLNKAIVDVSNLENCAALMAGNDVVISAVPYMFNLALAETAIETGCHFCDLGGNTEIVYKEIALNDKAAAKGVTVIPDCGLAPGMANVVAAFLMEKFDEVYDVKIRVGGLPENPIPPLNYMQLFSVHGLLNEYIGTATIIENGEIKGIPTMEGLETLSIGYEYPDLEAFYTLGGTSTLPESYKGKVRSLNYKTIRFPGHRDIIKSLFDLGFAEENEVDYNGVKIAPKTVLAERLVTKLPAEGKDMVLVKISVSGKKDEVVKEIVYDLVDRYDEENDMTAMMRTTGYPAAIVGQLMGRNLTNGPGAMPQEKALPLETFVEEMKKRNITFNVDERIIND